MDDAGGAEPRSDRPVGSNPFRRYRRWAVARTRERWVDGGGPGRLDRWGAGHPLVWGLIHGLLWGALLALIAWDGLGGWYEWAVLAVAGLQVVLGFLNGWTWRAALRDHEDASGR